MTTSLMKSIMAALLCLSAQRPIAASAVMEDAACALQASLATGSRPANRLSDVGSLQHQNGDCADEVQWNVEREVVTNNLGGLGPTGGPPVIHIRNFVDLKTSGRAVDLIVSNLTKYVPKNPSVNGLDGDFNNINMDVGTVDLLFSFNDALTGAPVLMPPFNLTIYDLDGPEKHPYAERVAIMDDDFLAYTLTPSTEVVVTSEAGMTVFGSSVFGVECDNPSSIEALGVVTCEGLTVDQRDRAVAVKMHGDQSTYHLRLDVVKGSKKKFVGGRNFLFGVPAYFNRTCPPPTFSPTAAPTASDVTTSFGDPHVSNLKGERFDILQNDYHAFLVIPRGSTEKDALLYLRAKVDPLGELCKGHLYVTSLRFTGLWVGHVGSLEFWASLQGPLDAEQAVKIKAGTSFLNISEFNKTIPQSLAEIAQFQPEEPRDLNKHVDTLVVKLKLGPTIAKVRMVYQKEKFGFSNSLWVTTSGMRHVDHNIGGILGVDDHTFAASSPRKCSDKDRKGMSRLLEGRAYLGLVHAAASFEDEDSG